MLMTSVVVLSVTIKSYMLSVIVLNKKMAFNAYSERGYAECHN